MNCEYINIACKQCGNKLQVENHSIKDNNISFKCCNENCSLYNELCTVDLKCIIKRNLNEIIPDKTERFKAIVAKYRTGEYGEGPMYLNDIMNKSGEPDLLEKMNEQELRHLKEIGLFDNKMLAFALQALKAKRNKPNE